MSENVAEACMELEDAVFSFLQKHNGNGNANANANGHAHAHAHAHSRSNRNKCNSNTNTYERKRSLRRIERSIQSLTKHLSASVIDMDADVNADVDVDVDEIHQHQHRHQHQHQHQQQLSPIIISNQSNQTMEALISIITEIPKYQHQYDPHNALQDLYHDIVSAVCPLIQQLQSVARRTYESHSQSQSQLQSQQQSLSLSLLSPHHLDRLLERVTYIALESRSGSVSGSGSGSGSQSRSRYNSKGGHGHGHIEDGDRNGEIGTRRNAGIDLGILQLLNSNLLHYENEQRQSPSQCQSQQQIYDNGNGNGNVNGNDNDNDNGNDNDNVDNDENANGNHCSSSSQNQNQNQSPILLSAGETLRLTQILIPLSLEHLSRPWNGWLMLDNDNDNDNGDGDGDGVDGRGEDWEEQQGGLQLRVLLNFLIRHLTVAVQVQNTTMKMTMTMTMDEDETTRMEKKKNRKRNKNRNDDIVSIDLDDEDSSRDGDDNDTSENYDQNECQRQRQHQSPPKLEEILFTLFERQLMDDSDADDDHSVNHGEVMDMVEDYTDLITSFLVESIDYAIDTVEHSAEHLGKYVVGSTRKSTKRSRARAHAPHTAKKDVGTGSSTTETDTGIERDVVDIYRRVKDSMRLSSIAVEMIELFHQNLGLPWDDTFQSHTMNLHKVFARFVAFYCTDAFLCHVRDAEDNIVSADNILLRLRTVVTSATTTTTALHKTGGDQGEVLGRGSTQPISKRQRVMSRPNDRHRYRHQHRMSMADKNAIATLGRTFYSIKSRNCEIAAPLLEHDMNQAGDIISKTFSRSKAGSKSKSKLKSSSVSRRQKMVAAHELTTMIQSCALSTLITPRGMDPGGEAADRCGHKSNLALFSTLVKPLLCHERTSSMKTKKGNPNVKTTSSSTMHTRLADSSNPWNFLIARNLPQKLSSMDEQRHEDQRELIPPGAITTGSASYVSDLRSHHTPSYGNVETNVNVQEIRDGNRHHFENVELFYNTVQDRINTLEVVRKKRAIARKS